MISVNVDRSMSDPVLFSLAANENVLHVKTNGTVYAVHTKSKASLKMAVENFEKVRNDIVIKARDWDILDADDRVELQEKVFDFSDDVFNALVKDERDRINLKRILTDTAQSRVEVTPHEIKIPWEFLNIADKGKPCYAGLKVMFSLHPQTDEGTRSLPSIRVSDAPEFDDTFQRFLGPTPTAKLVSFASDSGLPSGHNSANGVSSRQDREISVLEPLVKSLNEVQVLKDLDGSSSGNRQLELNELYKWLSENEAHIWHFACHSYDYEEDNEPTQKIRLRTDFCVSCNDITNMPGSLAAGQCNFAFDSQFLFLNCCNSAYNQYGIDYSVAMSFYNMNANVIVCTTGAVDDGYATNFARQFYRFVAAAEDKYEAWQALLETRQAMYENNGNPMGLFYTLMGNTRHTI